MIAGQGTIGREMLKQSPAIDVIVAGIGGGGLIAGIAIAAKAIKPAIRIIGVEPAGAPTLSRSLEAGALVTLDRIDTAANTLAPKRSAEINLEIVRDLVDDIVLVSDRGMRRGAEWLWLEMGQAVELAGAAAVAAAAGARRLRRCRCGHPPRRLQLFLRHQHRRRATRRDGDPRR